jgi:hypothetical protein
MKKKNRLMFKFCIIQQVIDMGKSIFSNFICFVIFIFPICGILSIGIFTKMIIFSCIVFPYFLYFNLFFVGQDSFKCNKSFFMFFSSGRENVRYILPNSINSKFSIEKSIFFNKSASKLCGGFIKLC